MSKNLISGNMVVNITKIFNKMESSLSRDIKCGKKYKKVLIFRICNFSPEI